MTWDDLLVRRDALIDQYLPAATVEDRRMLQLYLLEGEDSTSAASVPVPIRRLQEQIMEELNEVRLVTVVAGDYR